LAQNPRVRIGRPGATTLLACVLAFAAGPAVAQSPSSQVPRIGVIGERSPTDPFLAAFRQGLQELGYVEGQNVVVEYRYAHAALERVPKLADELVRGRVNVLVVGGTVSARSTKQAAPNLPIVFATVGDPIGSGLVASLARPGGNVTGMSNFLPELSGKQLEILKALLPQLSRAALAYNPTNPSGAAILNGARQAARTLGVELQLVEVRRRSEIAGVFPTLAASRAGALVVVSDPVFGSDLAEIARLAVTHRLPAVYLRKEFAEAGGLLAYGPSFEDNYRRAAAYVDKILKGARAGDLPVEQPTKFDFVINAGTARALGVTIPESLLLRADRVIP
jgi:putative ABC transport system substrate-binding protein